MAGEEASQGGLPIPTAVGTARGMGAHPGKNPGSWHLEGRRFFKRGCARRRVQCVWVVLGECAASTRLRVWSAARLACTGEHAVEAEAWLRAPPDCVVEARELLALLAREGCLVLVQLGLPALPAAALLEELEGGGVVDAEAALRLSLRLLARARLRVTGDAGY